MDDSGGIISSIGDVIGEAASAVADEAKKFGSSATGQVTGSKPAAQSPSDKSPLSGLAGFGKSLTSQITGGSADTTSPVGDLSAKEEAKNFGKSIISQITGGKSPGGQKADVDMHSKYQYSITGELSKLAKSATGQVSWNRDLNDMAKADEDFSKREAEAIKVKIARLYEEHAAKRKQEEEARKQQEIQIEQQKTQMKVQTLEQKKHDFVNPAIARSRAEIKNYGAE